MNVHSQSYTAVFAMAWLGFASTSLSACSEVPMAPVAEELGIVSAALSVTGPDGATYAFPQGAHLVTTEEHLAWSSVAQLDGSGASITQRLPEGSYRLELEFPNSASPTLLRTDTGGVQTLVSAEWIDALPYTMAIAAGRTTEVVLHFRVSGLGDLTFAVGSDHVTLAVTQSEDVRPTGGTIDGQLSPIKLDFSDPAAAYVAPLSLGIGVAQNVSMVLEVTGPWTIKYDDQACLPVSVATAVGDPVMFHYSQQLISATGEACITDSGAKDVLHIVVERFGRAPASQTAFLPDTYWFVAQLFDGNFPDVFDGATLRQSALTQAVAMQDGFFQHLVYTGATTLVDLHADFTGSFRLSASP
jgi:hypothetical protein